MPRPSKEQRWWLLRYELIPKPAPEQRDLFEEIPARLSRDDVVWALAEDWDRRVGTAGTGQVPWAISEIEGLEAGDDSGFSCLLHRPIQTSEWKKDGTLGRPDRPQREPTPAVFAPGPKLQFVAVHYHHRTARTGRVAARGVAAVLTRGLRHIGQHHHYMAQVDPMLMKGEFITWFRSLSELTSLSLTYRGPNLSDVMPVSRRLRGALGELMKDTRSHQVKAEFAEPALEEEEAEDLGEATERRELDLSAVGKAAQTGRTTRWSSKRKAKPRDEHFPEKAPPGDVFVMLTEQSATRVNDERSEPDDGPADG